MITWLFIVALAVIGLFGFVVLFGAPYLPTLSARKHDALRLLNLAPGQTLLELGSGDGRMLAAAAKQDIHAVGYELNPLLVIYSKLVTFRYRHLVTIKWANFWHHTLPPCDGIYVFLLDRYMPKLHNKITQEISNSVNPGRERPPLGRRHGNAKTLPISDGVKLVSFAFKIPDLKPVKELNGMYLYKYTPKNQRL